MGNLESGETVAAVWPGGGGIRAPSRNPCSRKRRSMTTFSSWWDVSGTTRGRWSTVVWTWNEIFSSDIRSATGSRSYEYAGYEMIDCVAYAAACRCSQGCMLLWCVGVYSYPTGSEVLLATKLSFVPLVPHSSGGENKLGSGVGQINNIWFRGTVVRGPREGHDLATWENFLKCFPCDLILPDLRPYMLKAGPQSLISHLTV